MSTKPSTQAMYETGELDIRIVESASSEELIEQLILENQAYLHSRVNRFAPTTLAENKDEMYSVALMAFYEAIKTYKPGKGHFYPFADIVIRRRIIDEIRKMSKSESEIAILDDVGEDGEEAHPVYVASIDNFRKESENSDLILEIEQFKEDLKKMGITMDSLVKHSPKHTQLKETYEKIIELIRYDEEVKEAIFKKHYYPVKKISEITKLSSKKLERSRTYIIAVMLILCNDYPHLSEYIPIAKRS